VPVGAELRLGTRLHRAHFALDRAPFAIDDLAFRLRDGDYIAFLEIRDLVGGAGQRERVGGEEALVLAFADHQRASGARAHHRVRLALGNDRDCVCAFELLHRRAHRLEQAAAMEAVDEVRDDLGIRLAFEAVAAALERCTQLFMVLDDAVVHHRDLAA
jgi:hypothetical protein